MKSKTQFDGMVLNAFDFFIRALDHEEIERHPKYSLLNFICGVDLILKARLLHEHWSLILIKPEDADFDKFCKGDFRSIRGDEAIDRIEKILQEKHLCCKLENLRDLRKIRNKLVHFYDEDYQFHHDVKCKNAINEVVSKELRIWYNVFPLIEKDWRSFFKDHLLKFKEIDKKAHKLKQYLRIKYDELKPLIEDKKYKGVIFINCPFCEYQSLEVGLVKSNPDTLFDANCLVCKNPTLVYVIECPACDLPIYYFGILDPVKCECGFNMEIQQYIENYIEVNDYRDCDVNIDRECLVCSASCIALKNQKFFCFKCFDEFNNGIECDRCKKLYFSNEEEVFFECGCGGHVARNLGNN